MNEASRFRFRNKTSAFSRSCASSQQPPTVRRHEQLRVRQTLCRDQKPDLRMASCLFTSHAIVTDTYLDPVLLTTPLIGPIPLDAIHNANIMSLEHPIARTCRQMRLEAQPMFYAHESFTVTVEGSRRRAPDDVA